MHSLVAKTSFLVCVLLLIFHFPHPFIQQSSFIGALYIGVGSLCIVLSIIVVLKALICPTRDDFDPEEPPDPVHVIDVSEDGIKPEQH